MALKQYLYPLQRWWWLILISTLVAALTSFFVVQNQDPVYQATTTLMMGRAIDDPNPSANEFWLGQRLAETYADIANRDLVRNATMETLDMTWLPAYKAQALPNSNLIEISVTDVSPERAQIVANELAHQLMLQTPTSINPSNQDRQQFVNQQLDTLEAQIEQTQADIEQLQAELGNLASARQINETQNQIAALNTKLNTLQNNYANLLANTFGGAINTISTIEPAARPSRPVGPAKASTILVSSAIGFVLAAGAAYLLEYLDDTVKGPEHVSRLTGAPIIGYIGEVTDSSIPEPYVTNVPRHPVSEAFRTLRANLEFAGIDRPLKTILVSSADTGEGKTTVATNLAIAMAQGDKRVALVDADLRRPNVHEALNIPNDNGLSEVFRGRTLLPSAMRVWQDEKVAVITSGSLPPNPAELLGSKRMNEILAQLSEVADVVVIDGPPFMVADAAVLAAKVDGVLLVIRPGYTREDAVKAMMEQVSRTGTEVLGVVLNGIPGKLSSYYGGQLYLSSYYHDSDRYFSTSQPKKKRPEKWRESLSSSSRSEISPVKRGSND